MSFTISISGGASDVDIEKVPAAVDALLAALQFDTPDKAAGQLILVSSKATHTASVGPNAPAARILDDIAAFEANPPAAPEAPAAPAAEPAASAEPAAPEASAEPAAAASEPSAEQVDPNAAPAAPEVPAAPSEPPVSQ